MDFQFTNLPPPSPNRNKPIMIKHRQINTKIGQIYPRPATQTGINWSYKIKPTTKSMAQTYLNNARLSTLDKILKTPSTFNDDDNDDDNNNNNNKKPLPSFHNNMNHQTGELLSLSPHYTHTHNHNQNDNPDFQPEQPQQPKQQTKTFPNPAAALAFKKRKYNKSIKDTQGAYRAYMRSLLRVMWMRAVTSSRFGYGYGVGMGIGMGMGGEVDWKSEKINKKVRKRMKRWRVELGMMGEVM